MTYMAGRRLVVGTSRADGIEEVVASAAALARRCGATLHVVHAGRQSGDLARILADAGIEATVEVAQGSSGPLLCRAAEERGADVVVVGATRQGPGFQHLLGSTAERVLRESTVPVLVLRGPLADMPAAVLYATDLSPHSLGAVARGRSTVECLFGRPPREECLLVARYGLPALPPLRGRSLVEVARDELARFVERVPGTVPLAPRVRTGTPAKEIVAAAAEIGAQLTVMGTHARNGAERFYLGSVAEQVLRTTLGHVLVVPTGARARPEPEEAEITAAGAA
jgi:universal stress protein E